MFIVLKKYKVHQGLSLVFTVHIRSSYMAKYQTVCLLLSEAVFGVPHEYAQETDWGAVYREMAIHGVAGIPCDLIGDLPLDDGVREAWKRYCVNQQIYYQRIAATQTEVCTAFEETGIGYVVLKGMAAAMYYPVPGYRTMGDIDILIKEEDLSGAEKVLWGLSFNRIRGINDRHLNFRRNDVELELHVKFARSKDEAAEKVLNNYLMIGFEKRDKKMAGRSPFYVFPVEQNGMVILQHLRQHLTEGIGLRQVTDWMCFVNYSGLTDWSVFNEISRRAGLFTFQKVLTKMCEKYLTLFKREDIAWCDEADDSVCDELMRFVLSRGNFGYKVKDGNLGGKIASAGGIGGGFARLQRGGMCRWEAVRRHPVLRPFAWLYQLIRVSGQFIRGEASVNLKDDMQEARSVTELMQKLEL